ncbi:outer membrane beta-barrel protein [Pedobacter sp. JCM 36344]|uniref:outer membrane beta-barrel protein n=1 Tax=Pedobacter sp. JCM 36344 TaxID=3374280 RepID=UPI00397AC67A
MKHFLFSAIMASGLAIASAPTAFSQTDTVVTVKTTTTTTTTKRGSKFSLIIGVSDTERAKKDSTQRANENKGRFVGGITFTRFDLGFSKLIDNGNFTLSPTNDFLDYKAAKTSTVSFDVLQIGYRFNSNFKVYVAGGFDWTMIRLKKDITIQKNSPVLTYVNENIQFSKNRLSSSYVHIPLNFELRTKENDNGKRFYFVIGPEVAFLLNGKVKQVSNERGKEKFKDDYNFEPFRYGGTVRIGYGGLGIFTKYYANDMFASSAQKGIKNLAFGITLGLN